MLHGYGFRQAELEKLPEAPGTYLLILRVSRASVRTKAKRFEIEPGRYLYVGSALSVSARVGRHLRREKRKHWHIDFLLEHAVVEGVLVAEARVEQEVALVLCRLLPHVRGFGCSDSKAVSHLFVLEPCTT